MLLDLPRKQTETSLALFELAEALEREAGEVDSPAARARRVVAAKLSAYGIAVEFSAAEDDEMSQMILSAPCLDVTLAVHSAVRADDPDAAMIALANRVSGFDERNVKHVH